MSPDADTTLLFTKPTTVPGATELGAGQVVEFLVGFSNKGDKDFVIETLDASFRWVILFPRCYVVGETKRCQFCAEFYVTL